MSHDGEEQEELRAAATAKRATGRVQRWRRANEDTASDATGKRKLGPDDFTGRGQNNASQVSVRAPSARANSDVNVECVHVYDVIERDILECIHNQLQN